MGADDEDALVVTEETERLVERYGAAGRGGPSWASSATGASQDDSENAADQVAQTSSQERSAGK